MDEGKMKAKLHRQVDEIVLSITQNLKAFLEATQLPDPSSSNSIHTTQVHLETSTNKSLQMKLSTEKFLVNINELLKLIKEIKTLLLLYDSSDIILYSHNFNRVLKEANTQDTEEIVKKYKQADQLEQQLFKLLQ
eukprot:403357868